MNDMNTMNDKDSMNHFKKFYDFKGGVGVGPNETFSCQATHVLKNKK
jgi:hypothetical protein